MQVTSSPDGIGTAQVVPKDSPVFIWPRTTIQRDFGLDFWLEQKRFVLVKSLSIAQQQNSRSEMINFFLTRPYQASESTVSLLRTCHVCDDYKNIMITRCLIRGSRWRTGHCSVRISGAWALSGCEERQRDRIRFLGQHADHNRKIIRFKLSSGQKWDCATMLFTPFRQRAHTSYLLPTNKCLNFLTKITFLGACDAAREVTNPE